MRWIGNWKVWEKYGKKRIYLGDKINNSYLEEGDSGLCNLVGQLSKDEIERLYKRIEKRLFNEIFEDVKKMQDAKKSEKKYNKYLNDLVKEGKITIEEKVKLRKEFELAN